MAEHNGESCTGTQTTQLFSQTTTHLLTALIYTHSLTNIPQYSCICQSLNGDFLSPLDYWAPQAKWQDFYSFLLPSSYPCPCYGAARLTISLGYFGLHSIPHTKTIYPHSLDCWIPSGLSTEKGFSPLTPMLVLALRPVSPVGSPSLLASGSSSLLPLHGLVQISSLWDWPAT